MVFELLFILSAMGQVGGRFDALLDEAPGPRLEKAAKIAAVEGDSNYRKLGPSKLITSPYDAVVLALGDADTKQADDQRYVRYLWVPDWMDRKMALAKASLVLNSTLSRVATIVQPAVLADGRLIRVDFRALTNDDDEADELVAVYENLAARESFFHVRQSTVASLRKQEQNLDFGIGETVEIQTVDPKKWVRGEIKGREGPNFRVQVTGRKTIDVTGPSSIRKIELPAEVKPKALRVTAAYAEPELRRLGELLHTDVPIMRLDEFNVFAFDSVNGGQYYKLTGITGTFQEVLTKFAGKGAADKINSVLKEQQRTGRVDAATARASSLTTCSNVTGRQRMSIVFYGDNLNPTIGPQGVWVTLDIAEDNDDPESDPFRNPLEFGKFDGGEAILLMPNGLLCYIVFDANLNLLNNVPENVAFNKEAVKVRSLAATARVSSGLVCARCHDADAAHFGFKPITNDALESQYELGSTIGDASRPGRARRANQESASNFGAELTGPLDQSRLIYQKQAHIATGYKTTRPVVFGLSEDYWGYWYDQATPVTVARDLGFNLNHDDAIRVLLAIAPSLENDPDPAGVLNETLKEDRVLARIKNGSRVTGMQWRTLFPLIAGRARQDQVREKIAVLIQERKQ